MEINKSTELIRQKIRQNLRLHQTPDFLLAQKICQKLQENGFVAYIAGGAVRDLILGRVPSDFDVATNAEPDQVESLFERTIAVGKFFGCIVVSEGAVQVEVTSFRADGKYINGRQPESIVFSDAKTDAQRRDFTINGFFLDLEVLEVIDYVEGLRDIEAQLIRAIGSPRDRFQEDHLRILRAVRFQSQLGFAIEESTEHALKEMKGLAFEVSGERIFQELSRLLKGEYVELSLETLSRCELLESVLEQKSQISWNYLRKIKHFNSIEGLDLQFKVWFQFLVGFLQIRRNPEFFDRLFEKWRISKALKSSLKKALQMLVSPEVLAKKRQGELLEISCESEGRYVLSCLDRLNVSAEFSSTWRELEKHPSFGLAKKPERFIKADDLKGRLQGEALGLALRVSYYLQLENPSWGRAEILQNLGGMQ